MKLQRCANGHFYDVDKYPTCPHCQEAGLPGFKDDETVTLPLNRTPGAVSSAGGAAMPAGGFGAGGGETALPSNTLFISARNFSFSGYSSSSAAVSISPAAPIEQSKYSAFIHSSP